MKRKKFGGEKANVRDSESYCKYGCLSFFCGQVIFVILSLPLATGIAKSTAENAIKKIKYKPIIK